MAWNMSRRGMIWVALLVVLAVAGAASAMPFSADDFVLFSGEGLSIGGHNLVTGFIGSNQDLSITGPTQINGSVYVGADLTVGSDSAFGSDGVTLSPDLDSSTRYTSPTVYPALLTEVVVNDYANFSGGSNLFANLYAADVRLGSDTVVKQVGGVGGNVEYTLSYTALSGAGYEGTLTTPSSKTFGLIIMPTATSFTAGGVDQQVPAGTDVLTLAPGTYGTLSTSESNATPEPQTVNLSSGEYYFDAISTQGGFRLRVDLTSGDPVSIYVVGDAVFAQDTLLEVKGAGTGGLYVPISAAPSLAGLINWETKGKFDLGGGDVNEWTTIFGGIVYSSYSGSGDGLIIDQRVDWYGSLYAYDTLHLADHSRFTFVPATTAGSVIPEPTTIALLGSGLLGLVLARRRRSSR